MIIFYRELAIAVSSALLHSFLEPLRDGGTQVAGASTQSPRRCL